jgi:hypothetical protein
MCRIGGKLRISIARYCGVAVEIPPFVYLEPNLFIRDSAWWVV